MDRINTPNAVPDGNGPGKRGFRNGNKAEGINPTEFNAEWCNGQQEEIAAVIEDAGFTLDDEDNAQLLAAINAKIAAALISTLPPKHKSGLTVSNNVAAPNTTLDIAPGKARDQSDTHNLVLAAGISKVVQAAGAWAAGSGANGLFSGARGNNTWYHIFLIRKDSDGTIEVGFDTSVSAANRPVGYTEYYRLGAVNTDGSGNIIKRINNQRTWTYLAPTNDAVNVTTLNNVRANLTVSVPPGIRCLVSLNVSLVGSNINGYISNPDMTDLSPNDLHTGGYANVPQTDGVNDTNSTANLTQLTNNNSQISYRTSIVGAMYLQTVSYTELD